ncbi:hypothetical protein L1889_03835 [Paenalcaligenes niemegkensis]|uniref:phage tail tube protein n=1 Tax=Paenalcaligenes niemegkensis TaxID=2895469 RepID=UPI001EE846CA|nr:phage tail tube protein [Paenalcaligenes niemegkensis]MCQ9615940.1 hypothetical protein [Paenalcaligenes niemegkensis]
MTAGVIKTQGTELFLLDSITGEEPAILKMLCPTSVTGLGSGTKSQIETTCLDTEEDQEFIPGLGAPGPLSVPFNFVPTAASHQGILTELKESGQLIPIMVAFSDGKTAPTLDIETGDFKAPAGRTCARFLAYVAEATIDAATNDKVTGNMSLQRSGKTTWSWNAPATP